MSCHHRESIQITISGSFNQSQELNTNMMFLQIVSLLAVNEEQYADYVPSMEVDADTWARYFELEDVQAYLKNVFNMENADLSSYMENGRVACTIVGDPDICVSAVDISRTVATAEGNIAVSGTVTAMDELEDQVIGIYPFCLYMKPNSESVFGCTLERFQYLEGKYLHLEEEQWELIAQMVVAAQNACISHWQMTENFQICPKDMHVLSKFEFAAEGCRFGWAFDGKEQATAEELAELFYQVTGEEFSKEELDAEFEMMQAEGSNFVYKGTDYEDGVANLYTHLDAFYGSGIFDRTEIDPDQYIFETRALYNSSGDQIILLSDAERFSDDYIAVSGVYTRYDVPFTIYLYEDEDSPIGYKLHYIYYFISESSKLGVTETEGQPQPDYIAQPDGIYKSNDGSSLDFYSEGKVNVSEGNSNTWCTYTVDAGGNLTIYSDSETIEGTYNAQEEEITIYQITFRKR